MGELIDWHPPFGRVKRRRNVRNTQDIGVQQSPTGLWTNRPVTNRVRGYATEPGVGSGQPKLEVEP